MGCLPYFFHHNDNVLYASAADDPEYDKLPIYHTILWKSMDYYKKRGFKFIEMSQPAGYNLIDGFSDYYDKKKISISHFKRGFGGEVVPFFRGIKYYDRDLLVNDIEVFKQKVQEAFE